MSNTEPLETVEQALEVFERACMDYYQDNGLDLKFIFRARIVFLETVKELLNE
jgi:hypothetical protein